MKKIYRQYAACMALCILAGCGGDTSMGELTASALPDNVPAPASVSATTSNVTNTAPTVVPPTSNDSDGDGVLNVEDNCPSVVNPDQRNSDAEYAQAGLLTPAGQPVVADALGDACDDDRDGDNIQATFVDGTYGDNDAPGTFAKPVRTIAQAIVLALAHQDELRLAAGTYHVDAVSWPDNLVMRGGYAKGFGARAVKNTSPTYAADLAGTGSSTLWLANVQGLVFDGVVVRNTADVDDATTIRLDHAGATFVDCLIEANPKARFVVALAARDASALTLERSRVLVNGGAQAVAGTAVLIDASQARVVNNFLTVEHVAHARGLEVYAAAVVALHNTVRVAGGFGDMATAYAASLADAPVVLANNVLLTEVAADQAPLVCAGVALPKAVLAANLLVATGGQWPQPVAIDCDGTYLSAQALTAETPFGGGILTATQALAGVSADVVMASDGTLSGVLGVDAADMTLATQYDVQRDYTGQLRGGPFDIGAWEGF